MGNTNQSGKGIRITLVLWPRKSGALLPGTAVLPKFPGLKLTLTVALTLTTYLP